MTTIYRREETTDQGIRLHAAEVKVREPAIVGGETCAKVSGSITPYLASKYSQRFIDTHYDGWNLLDEGNTDKMSRMRALSECAKIPDCAMTVVALLANGSKICKQDGEGSASRRSFVY